MVPAYIPFHNYMLFFFFYGFSLTRTIVLVRTVLAKIVRARSREDHRSRENRSLFRIVFLARILVVTVIILVRIIILTRTLTRGSLLLQGPSLSWGQFSWELSFSWGNSCEDRSRENHSSRGDHHTFKNHRSRGDRSRDSHLLREPSLSWRSLEDHFLTKIAPARITFSRKPWLH